MSPFPTKYILKSGTPVFEIHLGILSKSSIVFFLHLFKACIRLWVLLLFAVLETQAGGPRGCTFTVTLVLRISLFFSHKRQKLFFL